MPVGKLRWCGEAAVDSVSSGLAQRSNKFPQRSARGCRGLGRRIGEGYRRLDDLAMRFQCEPEASYCLFGSRLIGPAVGLLFVKFQ